MRYIIINEDRPFSFKDFLCFNSYGKDYKMTHGTFRNKISKFIKEDIVELAYNSGISFYTLKGAKIGGKTITPNHTGVPYTNNPLYRLLLEHPLGKTSVHDIRLLFEVKEIWKFLSINPQVKLNHFSKDIELGKWIIETNFFVSVAVHRTDSVSISVGCSYRPVSLDINGIMRFTSVLARIEERISGILQNGLIKDCDSTISPRSLIPSYTNWNVTMWHLNMDGLVEYSGEKFHISWEDAQHVIIRAYTKQFEDKKIRIRLEKQEYPNKSIFDAINDRLEGLVAS
jgi:hypothetical protein